MQNTNYNTQRELNRIKNYKEDNAPSRYVIVLTNKCNLSCSFCFQDRKKLPNAMTTKDWIEFIDKVKKNSHFTITGGEPLYYEDFDKVFLHVTKSHTANLICNGTRLTEKVCDLLLSRENFRVLSLSIDTIFNTSRDVKKDQYLRMMEALKHFKKRKKELGSKAILDTKTVVTDENAGNLLDIYKHCVEELGSATHVFQFLKGNPLQHADVEHQYHEIFQESKPYIYKEIKKIAEQFSKVRDYCLENKTVCYAHPNFISFSDFDQDYYPILEKKYNKEKFDKNDYQKCMGPWESGHINADGKVFPCLAINFGDVRNYKKTEDIYNSKVALEFKKLIKKEGTVNSCSRCGYLKLKSTHS